jgi:hypothetical protein
MADAKQGLAGGIADVEDKPMCGPVSEFEPLQEALAHVLKVEAFFDQAFDGAKQQRAIVAPGSGGLAMRAVAAHSDDGIELAFLT